ncbi:uncharacterized protein [Rutidosis leptorrhynchoides]|uniref:uncharacterized protein n=1 Tax=Rutidosis leptorrhynchoides TaxID=125765 RepID=UPI003A99FBA3
MECVVCHTSRYKISEDDSDDEDNLTANDHNKVPAKVLHYFPLVPRLQRLYMSSEATASMRWHEEGRTKDGLLRHLADSPAWQTFDHKYPEFAKGIPTPPRNNIDVYLAPVVDELKLLWDHGVETCDSSTNSNFQMRAGMRYAYRKDKNSFDDTEELETKPTCLTGSDVLNELNGIDLLPICIRNSLPKHVRSVVIKLCRYYRRLCCKVLDPTKLVQMENDIGKILCDMERIFPPSFFDVMVHISVHLAYEARIEYLATLKYYVRNRSKPEGSISEGYLADECLAFCSLYFADNVETIHNKKSRNYEDGGKEDGLPIFSMPGRPIGARKMSLLSLDLLTRAHSYVLFNCSELESFRIEHLSILHRENKKECQHLIQRMHYNKFEKWFGKHVRKLHKQGVDRISEDLRHLENGPSENVTTYKGYIVNGYRFQIKQTEKKRKMQNSGVMLEARTNSFSSVRDKNPIVGAVTYYGVLKEIIELQYGTDKKVVLFRCDWISNVQVKRKMKTGLQCSIFID